jgi:hypothetical protein
MIRKFIISAVLLSFLGNNTTYASDKPGLSEALPAELHKRVINWLELSDLNSLSSVCNHFRTLVWDLDFFKYSKPYITEIWPQIQDVDFYIDHKMPLGAVLESIKPENMPEGFSVKKIFYTENEIIEDQSVFDEKRASGEIKVASISYKTAFNNEYKMKVFQLAHPTIITCLSNGLSNAQCTQVLKKMIHSVCFCEFQWEFDNGITVDLNNNPYNKPKNFLLPESKPSLRVIWSNIHNKEALLDLPYLPSLVSFGLHSWEMSKSKLSSLTPDEQNKGRESLTKIVIAMDNFDEFKFFWDVFSQGMTDEQHLQLLNILADNTIVRTCQDKKMLTIWDKHFGMDFTRNTNTLVILGKPTSFRMGRDIYTFGMWISYILRSFPENLSNMLPEDKIKWLEEHKNKYVHN